MITVDFTIQIVSPTGGVGNTLAARTKLPFLPVVGNYIVDDILGNLIIKSVGFNLIGEVDITLEDIISDVMEGMVALLEKSGFSLLRSNSDEWKRRHPEVT